MIPVRKESDSLGRIAELEEAKRTFFPLGDLDQPYEDAKHSDGKHNEHQPTPLTIGKQERGKEDRKGWDKR